MNNTVKWAVGLIGSIIITLMTVQVTVTANMNQTLIDFTVSNSEQHSKIKDVVNKSKVWTEFVYEYEITPNTEFRKKYESIISQGK